MLAPMADSDASPRRFAAPRGVADVLPDDWPYWRYVRDTAERVCDRFGYQRIDTPIFEHAGVYLRSVGQGTDIVEKEVYLFEDRGGDELALRPEGTAGVVRAYLEHGMANLSQPVRVFYLAPNFRYDRPQAGRYRQHTQFGVEAIGDAGPLIDSEVIDVLWSFYRELGLRDITLKLNSIGDEKCRPGYIEALRAYYAEHIDEVCADDRMRLEKNPLRVLDCKDERCQPLIARAPRIADHLCDECREHFESLKSYLLALKIGFEQDHRLVRGLDYYTRTTFEVEPAEERSQSSLGGGGRYDGLAALLGGAPTPGIGFGTGVERIIINLKRQETPVEPLSTPAVYIAHLTPAAALAALEVAAAVRAAGRQAIVGPSGRSLKSQMRQADAKGAAWAAIIGEGELANGEVTLRNLRDHTDRKVRREEVPALVARS